MEQLQVVVFTDGDGAGKPVGTVIERQNQRARKIGRVERAGGVAKVVVEAEEAAASKELAQMSEHRIARGVFLASVPGTRATVCQ